MDEWEAVRQALISEHVAGAEDLGRFVNNVEFFRASTLDERAAMPVLLRLLPTLTEPRLVSSIAGHLRRPWCRPAAFEPLYEAFQAWAPRDEMVGWALGDAMANAARVEHLPLLIAVARDSRDGMARQMVVDALSRFKKSPDVPTTLLGLMTDSDVALHAMAALRRSIGPERAVPYLRDVQQRYDGQALGKVAKRELHKAEKAVERRAAG